MSDISIPGLSPTTSKLVNDLVEAEKIRLTDMEERIAILEKNQSMWRDIYRDVGELQRSSKALYGFENPFSERIVQSSNESVLSASASRTAPLDEYSLTIKQVASASRFISPSLPKGYRLEAGKYGFRIGDETIFMNYKGGNLKDFVRRLNEKGKGIIKASTVQDTYDTRVLLIEALPTGSNNRLVFLDQAREAGLKMGMLRELPNIHAKVEPNSTTIEPGQSVSLKLSQTVSNQKGLFLEYSYRTIEHPETSPPQAPGPSWPKAPEVNFKGFTVTGPENSTSLPPDKNQSAVMERRDDWTVFEARGSTGTKVLPAIKPSIDLQMVQVPIEELPRDLSEILVNNNNTHRSVEIVNIHVYNPNKVDGIEPVNPVSLASDAIVNFKGIEARRPSNTIDDLLDGVSLELKRAHEENVNLKVEPDSETIKDSLIRFVFSYNRLITRILVVTNDDDSIIDELSYLNEEERQVLQEQKNKLRGNSSLNRLKSRLQSLVTNPYQTDKENDIRLLTQIGISTNASSGRSGRAVDFSKLRGYLEIDEDILDSSIARNTESIKDMFGFDSDEDLVIDSGIGYKMDEYLNLYYSRNGILPNRISSVSREIEEKEKEVEDYKVYLEDYKSKLRIQYGKMDAALQELERSSRELDNFNKGSNR